jgi:hypothetical protein
MMQEEKTTPFSVSGAFEANPHLYDYIHHLSFSPLGIVEIMDGAGQVLNALIKGRFSVQARDQSSVLVHFSDLVELKQKPPFLAQPRDPDYSSTDYSDIDWIENPDYQVEEPIRSLVPISVILTREEGIFPFMQQVVWKIHDKQEWPCLLYRVRYAFEIDPLEQVLSNRIDNLYYDMEAEEPDTRYYYRQGDAQKLSAQELAQMGILFS